MTIAVVSDEDCAKAWDELTPEQQAWIEDRRMYWAVCDPDDHPLSGKSAGEVWDHLSAEERRSDLDGMDRPVGDAIIDRRLQAAINSVLADPIIRQAAVGLGAPEEFPEIVDYALKLAGRLKARTMRATESSERTRFERAIERMRSAASSGRPQADRIAQRQFHDGFDGVEPAKVSPPDVDILRIGELAALEKLSVQHWIEITGVGVGTHESFEITTEGVSFRKWDFDFIKQSPQDWQIEMLAENETPPLAFPCTPARLAEFVRNAPGVHNFKLLKGFEEAVSAEPALDQKGVSDVSVNRPEYPSAQQRKLILTTLEQLGHDPLNLPKRHNGKAWVRSDVAKKLVPKIMTKWSFKHAWDELRSRKEIRDGEAP